MFHWHEIETVLLDMDGTLLDLHYDNYFWLNHLPQQYAQHHGIDEAAALAKLTLQMQDKVGQLEWYCLDYWSELTGLPIKQLKADVQHKIQFRPHVPDFLRALHDAGKRVVIVTNAHRDSVDLKMRSTGLDKMVDRVISSHDYRFPKEEQAFWQALQVDEPFDLQHTVLIDDSLAVLESAKLFGFSHLLCIDQPDSQKPKRALNNYRSIDHFSEIMPIARLSTKIDD